MIARPQLCAEGSGASMLDLPPFCLTPFCVRMQRQAMLGGVKDLGGLLDLKYRFDEHNQPNKCSECGDQTSELG